jgi:GDPmannose 4,6-dehydratase
LGNLDAKRDWGFAPEYVEAMWRILQEEKPTDFVLGTGEAHSVREFLEEAFGYVNLSWQDHIGQDPHYLRPLDVECLLADGRKARERLGWQPRITFRQLVRIMVDCDLGLEGIPAPGQGLRVLEAAGISWTRNQSAVSVT